MWAHFYFLRHGQTDWNVENRSQGQQAYVPLNQVGVQQAHEAAAILKAYSIDLIISSTLQRAKMTAEIVAQQIDRPVVFDGRLIEKSQGVLEGKTKTEIEATAPAELFDLQIPIDWTGRYSPKGAELIKDLEARAVSAVADLLQYYEQQSLLLVGHGAWFRALVYRLTNGQQIIRSENANPYFCELRDKNWDFRPIREN